MSFLYIFIVALTIAVGADSADLRCSPSLRDSMPLLDFPEFMGVWKLYGSLYGSKMDIILHCWEIEWKIKAISPAGAVIDASERYPSRTYEYNTTIVVNNMGRPGKWNSIDTNSGDSRSLYIVHTDYHQNALIAGCSRESDGEEFLSFLLLARNPENPVIAEEYKKIMTLGYGMNIDYFIEHRKDDADPTCQSI